MHLLHASVGVAGGSGAFQALGFVQNVQKGTSASFERIDVRAQAVAAPTRAARPSGGRRRGGRRTSRGCWGRA